MLLCDNYIQVFHAMFLFCHYYFRNVKSVVRREKKTECCSVMTVIKRSICSVSDPLCSMFQPVIGIVQLVQ